MARYTLDCRQIPSESGCTVSISADTWEETLEAAVHHAIKAHGDKDTPALRETLIQGVQVT